MIIIAIIVIIFINGKLTMDIPLGGSSFPLFSDWVLIWSAGFCQ